MKDELTSCFRCKHYDAGFYDSDTGYTEYPSCNVTNKLHEDGDASEQAALLFQNILFTLSSANNCPMVEPVGVIDTSKPRRSILDLKDS